MTGRSEGVGKLLRPVPGGVVAVLVILAGRVGSRFEPVQAVVSIGNGGGLAKTQPANRRIEQAGGDQKKTPKVSETFGV
jgi:hypothetical protein